jgi:hypothetical protein
MANILQFTLGLSTGSFLAKIAEARGAAGAFITSLIGVEAIQAGFMGALERGVGLQHLSKQTGESVGNLYKLQRGFLSAGLSADDVGPILFRMNRALGGINEMGERTPDIFKRLGLSLHSLRTGGSIPALQSILTVLGRHNQSSAASAATSIFGRMGAQSMVQLSRSSKEFAEGIKEAAGGALMFQGAAAAIERLHHTFVTLKADAELIWLGLLSGVAPAIQSTLDLLKKIDFAKIGAKLGEFIQTLGEVFGSGQISTLVVLAFAAGFEQALFYGERFIVTFCAGLAAAIPSAIEAGLQGSLSLLENFGQTIHRRRDQSKVEGLKGEIDKLQHPEKAPWYDVNKHLPKANREAMAAARQAEIDEIEKGGLDMNAGVAQDTARRNRAMVAAIEDAMKKGGAAGSEAWGSFGAAPTDALDRLKEFWARFHKSPGSSDNPEHPPRKDFPDEITGGYHPKFTSLEKMGFAMTGLGNPGLDATRTIAQNTGETVNLLRQLVGQSPAGAELIHQPS